MKELDNELGFFGEAEDMPDFEAETLAESPEANEPEEDTTEPEQSAESAEEAPTKAPSKPNTYEALILEEMKHRATTDPLLAKGLESADKSISECFRYVTAQARKEATGNCAMIEDNKVYGWAVHYYIEPKEVIDKELAPKGGKKAVSDKAVKKIKANPLLSSLMDKKGFKPTEEGAVVKTTTMKGGATKEVKVEDKAKTITLKGKAGQLVITEYSLF